MADRTPLTSAARLLGDVFRSHGFTADGVAAHLGPAATDALHRGEPGAVRRLLNDGNALSRLIRFFILREPLSRARVEALLGRTALEGLIAAEAVAVDGEKVQLLIDVRPHVIAGTDHWVFSDADASMTAHVPGPEHVPGVGAASLSLLQACDLTDVDSVLDLGTGSGVLALGQLGCALSVTATDVHPRALDFAEATLAASGSDAELLEGSWFEPVASRRFERIVANPPFVVGAGKIGHVYRDSGLELDGATAKVVEQAREHLVEGGTAIMLGAWAHTGGSDWRQRVASWLPDRGVDAWVLQRDVADPELYVGTWLRDESIDPRSEEGRSRTEQWLEFFSRNEVTAIGFGFIALRALDENEPTQLTAEELTQPFTDPLGPEITEYFLRNAWLRQHSPEEIAGAQFQLRPTVAREDVFLPDQDAGVGFKRQVIRLTRTDGRAFPTRSTRRWSRSSPGFSQRVCRWPIR